MKKLTFEVIIFVASMIACTLLLTLLFGNTSWLSGTGLTTYDKAYIGDGGVLKQMGTSLMSPASRIYYDYSRDAQLHGTYDWSDITYPSSLQFESK